MSLWRRWWCPQRQKRRKLMVFMFNLNLNTRLLPLFGNITLELVMGNTRLPEYRVSELELLN